MKEEQCPNKELCGSCGWSHIPYEKQLQQKLSDINGSFALKGLPLSCNEIIPSPILSHYRNRMDFVISFKGEVGLREKGKWWRVIDNHTCFISDRIIEEKFRIVREWAQSCGLTFFDRKSFKGFLRYAVIRATSTGECMVTVVTSAPGDTDESVARAALENLSAKLDVTTTIWSINHTTGDVSQGQELRVVSGPGYIEENINNFRYRITPNSFFQTNSKGAALLQDVVKGFAKELHPKTLLDLYCGSGFFSIALSQQATKVIGIETVSEMIEDARINAEINNLKIDYQVAKAEESDWKKLNADLIILDPPRSGLHDDVVKDLLEARPQNIIYVSCNYKSFAREMVELGKLYIVEEIKAIDMFPHTPHVELISRLRAI